MNVFKRLKQAERDITKLIQKVSDLNAKVYKLEKDKQPQTAVTRQSEYWGN